MPDIEPLERPKILLLQGPNMNWLGRRQPELYGKTTAAELDEICRRHAKEKGYDLTIFYTNSEGAALDFIYDLMEKDVMDGLVMNPAGWSVGGIIDALLPDEHRPPLH